MKLADCAAITRSQFSATFAPAPAATPLTAAKRGTGMERCKYAYEKSTEEIKICARSLYMKNRFDEYGVTRELVQPHDHFDLLVRSDSPSDAVEIEKAILPLVPQPCGHSLILVGGRRDGGYLIPEDLSGIEACFSPGVYNFKNFEDELALRFGIKSFMCDYSSDPTSLLTPLMDGMQFFEKKWLDVKAGAQSIDIDDWVRSASSSGADLLLQMDIEGAEYRNILHASTETLSRFRIISVELHGLHLLGEYGFLQGIFAPTIRKLASLFTCVHAHANNSCGVTELGPGIEVPDVLEVTFLRHDRVKSTGSRPILPNPLDVLNTPDNPPLHLTGLWLRHADPVRSDLVAVRQSVEWLTARVQRHNLELNSLAHLLAIDRIRTLDPTINVARGKVATQSSLWPGSTAESANGAINGIKTGSFGFHTLCELNPWWMVDLGEMFIISDIVVYNRVDFCSERSRTLKVSISLDAQKWQLIYDHEGREPFGGAWSLKPPLLVGLANVRARFVKLECAEETYFHLDEVEVFGQREPVDELK
jgi:hypothetical protein